jgi:hypothetical protein
MTCGQGRLHARLLSACLRRSMISTLNLRDNDINTTTMAQLHDYIVSTIHVPGASLSQIRWFAFGQITMMALILCLYCKSYVSRHIFQYLHSRLSLQDPHAPSYLWLRFQLISFSSESYLPIRNYFHTLYLRHNTHVWHEN